MAELALLRRPLDGTRPALRGPVARRMLAACWPHRARFVTPMAAVAGAVADEVLAAMAAGRTLERAYVNNGGDIAVHLGPGSALAAGVVNDPDRPGLDAEIVLRAERAPRGMATSGWRGRSQSCLGHRRCGNSRARSNRRRGRCGGDADRQRDHGRPPGSGARAGVARCARTATSARGA